MRPYRCVVSTLVVIPARGGSKGLPGKNLKRVAGVSLVGHAARVGRQFLRAASIDDGLVMVDTDSPEIAREAEQWGASSPFLRDASVAGDLTSTVESTLAALDRLASSGRTFDNIVLLQPTSPLRTVEDVLACWRAFDPVTSPSVTTVRRGSHPVSMALGINEDGRIAWLDADGGGWRRRQDAEPEFWLTGAVYVIAVPTLRADHAFIVSGVTRAVEQVEGRAIDIDTATDLAIADALAAETSGTSIAIAGAKIGGGARCFIIAEAGVNHNGDPKRAHKLVDMAADADADAVKFQTFDPDFLVARSAEKAGYQIANTGGGETQYEMLQRLTLPLGVYSELAAHAAERGILFLSTAFDETTSDFLETLDLPAYKVASGEVTNHAFLAHLARKGRPLLLSTGMSTLAEVGRAVEAIRENGNPPLALFHCVTNYPAAPADCNLRAMDTMRRVFGVPVGWSDHTEGLTTSLASVSIGADLLEKHFTMDRGLPGPDHAASLEPGELTALVTAVREVEAARGDGVKAPTAAEALNIPVVRRSLHLRCDLPAGHVLTAEDLIALRPGTGIAPSAREAVVGRRLRAGVRAGCMLLESDLG